MILLMRRRLARERREPGAGCEPRRSETNELCDVAALGRIEWAGPETRVLPREPHGPEYGDLCVVRAAGNAAEDDVADLAGHPIA